MIGISNETYTDLATNEKKDSIYLRLYISAFTEGLIAELTGNQFKVLMSICTYMDAKGYCYPTQQQLSERSGLNKSTVNKLVNELLAFKFNDKPIINREMQQNGVFKNSVYTVQPVSQVAIFGGQVESISTSTEVSTVVSTKKSNESKFPTSKQVGELYTEVFRETYGVIPNINFARDYTQVKNKWIGKFTDEQIETMVVTGVKEYDARWKNPKFERPTLSALVSWIGEQALGIAFNSEKEFKDVSEMTSNYVSVNDNALSRLQNRLNK